MNALVGNPDVEVVDRAHALHGDIRRCQGAIRTVWIHLAGDLYEFHDDRLWEALGYVSFEEWLASPEIDLGQRQVYRLIQIYRVLVIDREVSPEALGVADVTKVAVTLPALTAGKVTVEDALSDASTLSRADLQERYSGDLDAPLSAQDEPELHECPTCGRVHKAKRT